jgi:hypothetical protein
VPSPRQHLLIFRQFDSRENRIAMDDLPSQDTNFAGPAAPSATPERNLDAGMLETIHQVFACPDVDRLPGAWANGYERRIALPGTRTHRICLALRKPASSTNKVFPRAACSPDHLLRRLIVLFGQVDRNAFGTLKQKS